MPFHYAEILWVKMLADSYKWRGGCQHTDGNTWFNFRNFVKILCQPFTTEKSVKAKKPRKTLPNFYKKHLVWQLNS